MAGDTSGWTVSAQAWIDDLTSDKEFGRRHVLDPVMMARVTDRRYGRALDVGCGEGRFCRMMRQCGIAPIGIDPTGPLIDEARRRDPTGDYRVGVAERLDFADGAFDLVVSYLSLIDIPDIAAGIREMARVLAPGGVLLIANLASFKTAMDIPPDATQWRGPIRVIRGYLQERSGWAAWRGIRVRNHHRPLSRYMELLLGAGLELRSFAEPPSVGGPPDRVQTHDDAPWFNVMEWRKPG